MPARAPHRSTQQWRRYVGREADAFEETFAGAFESYRDILLELAPSGDVRRLTAAQWEEASLALEDAWTGEIAKVVEVAARASMLQMKVPEESFHIQNPYTTEWLTTHGGELITEVTESTQAGVRAAVRQAILDEESPEVMKRTIRDMVGLREDQVEALGRFEDSLPDDMPEGKVRAAVEREATRKLNYRAKTIARTETMRAANAGIRQSWDVARAEGLLPPGLMEKEWIAGADDRLCDACEEAAGQRVPIDEPFEYDGEEIDGPPAHPCCRCTMGLRIVEETDEEDA